MQVRDSVSILVEDRMAFTVHVSNTSFLYPVDDFVSQTSDGVSYNKCVCVCVCMCVCACVCGVCALVRACVCTFCP